MPFKVKLLADKGFFRALLSLIGSQNSDKGFEPDIKWSLPLIKIGTIYTQVLQQENISPNFDFCTCLSKNVVKHRENKGLFD